MAMKKKISKLVDFVKNERPQDFLGDWERINLIPGSKTSEKAAPSAGEKASEAKK